jgi:phosphoribosylglycinamide formyltransferase-1
MDKLKVAILVSGRGSNMEALLSAAAAADYPAEIVRVISNRPGAGALDKAQRGGIATEVIDHRAYADRRSFDAAGVELVVLAGFMRLLSEDFVERWHDRLINIHPSLLPLFPGLDTHERALAAGVKLHGCTVHFVRAELDCGPIIGQAAVPVMELYPLCLRLIAEGRVRVAGERAVIEGLSDDTAVLINPSG